MIQYAGIQPACLRLWGDNRAVAKRPVVKNVRRISTIVIAFTIAGRAALGGQSAGPSISSPANADTTIVIERNTKTIDVREGDTVLFKVGVKQFTLKFDGNAYSYDLSKVAPAGIVKRKIKVIVAPNPQNHTQGIP